MLKRLFCFTFAAEKLYMWNTCSTDTAVSTYFLFFLPKNFIF